MVALLADEVTRIAMPDVSGCTWEEKLRVVVSSSPQVYSQFPGISAAILSQSLKPLHWPHALRLRTAILDALREAGLSAHLADVAYIQFATITMSSLILYENHMAPEPGDLRLQNIGEGIARSLDLMIDDIKRIAARPS